MLMTPDSCDSVFLRLTKLYAALPLRASCSMPLSCDTQTATTEDIEGDPAFDLPQRED